MAIEGTRKPSALPMATGTMFPARSRQQEHVGSRVLQSKRLDRGQSDIRPPEHVRCRHGICYVGMLHALHGTRSSADRGAAAKGVYQPLGGRDAPFRVLARGLRIDGC